jgi:hypothetical protein
MTVVLFVSGVCDDCIEDFALINDVSNQRRLQETAVQEAKSNCYCPPEAEKIIQVPGADQITSSFQTELNQQNSVAQISGVQEIPVADCRQETAPFITMVKIKLFMSTGTSSAVIDRVAAVYQNSYNDLQNKFCDPFLRRIDVIEVINFSQGAIGSNGCREYEINLDISGRCRGCVDGTSIYGQANMVRRNLQTGNLNQPPLLGKQNKSLGGRIQRRLETDDECFCTGTTQGNRAPTRSEVNIAFEKALAKTKISDVCGTTDKKPPPNVPETSSLKGPVEPGQPPPPPSPQNSGRKSIAWTVHPMVEDTISNPFYFFCF